MAVRHQPRPYGKKGCVSTSDSAGTRHRLLHIGMENDAPDKESHRQGGIQGHIRGHCGDRRNLCGGQATQGEHTLRDGHAQQTGKRDIKDPSGRNQGKKHWQGPCRCDSS